MKEKETFPEPCNKLSEQGMDPGLGFFESGNEEEDEEEDTKADNQTLREQTGMIIKT